MKRKHIILTLFFLMFSSLTYAAGNTAVNGVAARAESMQAFVAVADDPSAIYYNPAGLTQLSGTHIDTSLLFMMPYQKFTNSSSSISSDTWLFVPGSSLFVSSDFMKPVTLGFGVYSPFARKARFENNAAVLNLPNKSLFLRLDAVPTIAMPLSSSISVGAGIVLSDVITRSNILGLRERAHGFGLTGQGGVMITPSEEFKIGLNFRGPMNACMDGKGFMSGLQGDYTTNLKFPATASIGAAWQMTDTILFSVGYDREFWDRFSQVNKHYNNPAFAAVSTVVVNAEDSDDIHVGIRIKPTPENEFTAGYTYSEIAVPPVNIVPAKPDFDAHYISVGYSRYIQNWRFDIAYELGLARDLISNNTYFPGKHHAHMDTVMLGIAYTIPTPA